MYKPYNDHAYRFLECTRNEKSVYLIMTMPMDFLNAHASLILLTFPLLLTYCSVVHLYPIFIC